MPHDVQQWLGEIKLLKAQLVAMQQERDEAYQSAANWRKRYETEAQQRRTEVNLAKQRIESLETELQQLWHSAPGSENEAVDWAAIHQTVEQVKTPEALKQELATVMAERDRLLQKLRIEQAEHEKTRQNLTTALGDAVNQLAKTRSTTNNGENSARLQGATLPGTPEH